VAGSPAASLWKPAGVPLGGLQQVVLALDEFEALRLADLEGQYQEEAAARMGVSRPTLGRILEAARRKVADALVHGHALRIEGGTVVCEEPRACCRWHDGQATDNQAVGEGPGRTCRRRRDRKEGPR
jgi:predicted DNA-binding protein (UPF0251 family)